MTETNDQNKKEKFIALFSQLYGNDVLIIDAHYQIALEKNRVDLYISNMEELKQELRDFYDRERQIRWIV